jgi:ATP-binding cassette subfamily B protein
MTQSPATVVAQHPAFQQLSPEGLSWLEARLSYERFRPGQQLAEADLIPSRALLILEGQARLLAHDRDTWVTLAKLGAGQWIGLASLLRAAACEESIASSELVCAVLADADLLHLYQQEPSFRQWCDATLFPAETAALMRQLWQQSLRPELRLNDVVRAGLEHGQLVAPHAEALQALSPDQQVFLASHNCSQGALGQALDPAEPLPPALPPFPLRLIALPQGLLKELNTTPQRKGETDASTDAAGLEIREASNAPLATSLNLGQSVSIGPEFKLIRAQGALEETLACFQMLAQWMKLPFRKDSIERVIRDALRRGQAPNLPMVGQLAAGMGLHAVAATMPSALGVRLQTPSLVAWKNGFALATQSSAAGLKLASPQEGWVNLGPEELEAAFPEGIDVLMVDRTISTPEQRFDLSWFLPAINRYKGPLLQVLLASFVVQLFSLANPLLIQVIIDKVISQRSLDTLQVLGIALVVVTLLEGLLGSLRTFLFADTTNRIDTRLGAEVIDHLLRLPLGYFDRRPVGELGTRVAELEKIRNFLTGQALTTVLDAAFSVIYIAVMAFYSWVLTIVALIVVPIQIGITLLGAPLFRRQFRQSAEANARTQSHLVEVLTGIQTVKAQNVETVSRWKWQERYSDYIARSYEKTITGTAINETSQVLQKLSQLLVLWVGAALVLKGELTLGQLIAFRIISGYVTQPLLRLSNIWQNIQELRVSFERLADVVDTPQESNQADQGKIPLPPIHGAVHFENLSFAFNPQAGPVLKNIELEIPTGTFVGVVGQSGSGKSTLMKLLPRLYSPDQGRILIDGYDIDKVELYSLRRQIGIVPQDPLLFSGSVNNNIALTTPDAGSESIVKAARIACAHEFIMTLPEGYSTNVGERGANLSGGQRQRLAIARTIISNPKLLVMDEATSALDYDTERRVCDNLRESLQGCTVFFITHRLSTVRNANLIVMMHQGAIVETGTHDELMALRGRYYALYRQQEAS